MQFGDWVQVEVEAGVTKKQGAEGAGKSERSESGVKHLAFGPFAAGKMGVAERHI
jgi:hypothetical protein